MSTPDPDLTTAPTAAPSNAPTNAPTSGPTNAPTTAATAAVPAGPAWLSCPPFYQWLDPRLEQLGGGRCELSLAPRPELGNSKGDLHGGAIAALFDIAMSQAVRSAYADKINVSTIGLTVNYLATSQGTVRISAQALRPGSTIAYAEVEALNAAGECVARASGNYRIIRPKPRAGAQGAA